MYLLTVDVERWANPPPMSSFRSLPSGVRIAQPQQGQSSASVGSTNNNNNTPEALPSAPPATNQSETPSGANSSQSSVISPRAAEEEPITMETENPPIANEENSANTSKSVDFNAKKLSLTALEPKASCSSSISTESLEVEIARMKEQRTCKVCMDNEVGVVFLPCGHLICCVNCAPSLKDCAVCRTPIQGTVRTFMS